ncbi:MAG: aldo/keto reductase [Balneolaceae bacterium]|nr:aldo/keto reductase [Balneolaceae bacterium]
MDYNTVGTSELNVSEVSFGCMSLDPRQETANTLLRQAYDAGINFFDTADLYDRGRNEEIVGQALAPVRSNVYIATKVGNVWKEDGSGWDWKPTKEHILSAVDESLKRLQTDYIDLYQLHGGTIDDPIDDIIEAFELLKAEGKIRAYGISSIRPNVIRQYVDRSNIDSVMMQYSLLDRRPEEFCLNLLKEHHISVLCRGTLGKGLLIGKKLKEYLGYNIWQLRKLRVSMKELGNPIAQALRFVLQHPAVASAVTGVRTAQQLNEIIHSLEVPVSKQHLQILSEILTPNYYQKHR